MKKPIQRLTAKETLDLLNTQWATIEDIMKLAYIGETKARQIGQEITNLILEEDKKILPRGLYPMAKVQEYLGININYLKKIERG